jgi:hypothetical protein
MRQNPRPDESISMHQQAPPYLWDAAALFICILSITCAKKGA